MRGYLLAKAVALTSVTSLAALTFAAGPQDAQSAGLTPATASPRTPAPVATPASGVILHDGIPGELAPDGIYTQYTQSGEVILRDASPGKNPRVPAPPTSTPRTDYLVGCV